MNNSKDIIPILTRCSLGAPLSEAELKVLEDWKAGSGKNARLFEELTDEGAKARHLKVFSSIDQDQDWNNMKKRMQAQKRPKVYFFRKAMPYAAAVLIGLLLYLGKYIYSEYRQTEVGRQLSKSMPAIPPASKNATLILSNGHEVSLNPHTNIKNNQGLSLTSTDKELQVTVSPGGQANPAALNVLIVPRGAYYSIVLSDHTKVWVNANSKLSFPNVFAKNERRVKVEGEAFFEVSHDPEHPFYVEAKGVQVKVLGTKFNVNAYAENVKTTLENGKVELLSNHQRAVLLPGQSAEWNQGKLQIRPANMAKELAWKQGEFHFENDDIEHIASELSRWYDVQIKFAGNVNRKKQYSGTMSRSLPLANVLNVLRFASDLDFEIQERELMIRSK